jgi:hypothetical protein
MPDKSIIPTKYHAFISPSLRRVFLDAQEDNSRAAMIENLKAEIAALKMHVTSLSLLVDDSHALKFNRLRVGPQIPTSWVKTGLNLFFLPIFTFIGFLRSCTI